MLPDKMQLLFLCVYMTPGSFFGLLEKLKPNLIVPLFGPFFISQLKKHFEKLGRMVPKQLLLGNNIFSQKKNAYILEF